jgi:hypothetical protein
MRIIIGQKGYEFDKNNTEIEGADVAPNDGAMVLVAKYFIHILIRFCKQIVC